MFPLRDENPHPPGFKPRVTFALIIANVIVFFLQVAYTGQSLILQIKMRLSCFTTGVQFQAVSQANLVE